MSGGLALIGEVWHTSNAREKEAELLFIGNEYRRAIERYYLAGSGVRQYPKNLADLVKDPRQPGTVRHLRRLYPDPITGSEEWGLVKSADGGFAGVHSLSEAHAAEDRGLRGARCLVRGQVEVLRLAVRVHPGGSAGGEAGRQAGSEAGCPAGRAAGRPAGRAAGRPAGAREAAGAELVDRGAEG